MTTVPMFELRAPAAVSTRLTGNYRRRRKKIGH
jgi:hypothetical protein